MLGLAPWTAPAVIGLLLAVIFFTAPARGQWRSAVRIFELSLGVRLMVLTVCYAARGALGIETVNPDVAGYLSWGRDVAQFLPAVFDIRPIFRAATYDIGFHYLLGFEIWLFGDDPLTLLSLNAVAGAAAVVALYLLLRMANGRLPFLIASVAAFYPGLVFISAGDLFKDPWVLLAAFGGLTLALRAVETRSRPILWSIGAGLCLFCLHITRFYMLPLVLMCLGGAASADAWRRRANLRPWLRSWAPLAAGLAIGSGVPALLIEQPSVIKESMSYVHVFRGHSEAFLGPDGRVLSHLRTGPLENDRPALGVARIATDLVRRFYGPYLWVLPRGDSFSLVEGGFWDYLGVPIWYALLPVGLLATSRLWVRRTEPIAVMVLLGCVMTVALYCIFSISYRQRSSLPVPFLILALGLSLGNFRRLALRRVLLLQAALILLLAAFYYILVR
jgi:hypothetical protein